VLFLINWQHDIQLNSSVSPQEDADIFQHSPTLAHRVERCNSTQLTIGLHEQLSCRFGRVNLSMLECISVEPRAEKQVLGRWIVIPDVSLMYSLLLNSQIETNSPTAHSIVKCIRGLCTEH